MLALVRAHVFGGLASRHMQSAALPPPTEPRHTHTCSHSLAGALRVCEWLFHMYVAVLAFFPGAGPRGSAGKQGDGARVHFRPSACLCTRVLKSKVEEKASH